VELDFQQSLIRVALVPDISGGSVAAGLSAQLIRRTVTSVSGKSRCLQRDCQELLFLGSPVLAAAYIK